MLYSILERVLSIMFCFGTEWATGWDYLGFYSIILFNVAGVGRMLFQEDV